jgi:hypothetical protein
MKENTISIKINRPVQDVFEYTINPNNTSKWIEHLIFEESSTYPPVLGTTYRNHCSDGVWDEYEVTDITADQVFELSSKDGVYHVRYTYKAIDNEKSELEYFEWVDEDELDNPFGLNELNKLKELMESK